MGQAELSYPPFRNIHNTLIGRACHEEVGHFDQNLAHLIQVPRTHGNMCQTSTSPVIPPSSRRKPMVRTRMKLYMSLKVSIPLPNQVSRSMHVCTSKTVIWYKFFATPVIKIPAPHERLLHNKGIYLPCLKNGSMTLVVTPALCIRMDQLLYSMQDGPGWESVSRLHANYPAVRSPFFGGN